MVLDSSRSPELCAAWLRSGLREPVTEGGIQPSLSRLAGEGWISKGQFGCNKRGEGRMLLGGQARSSPQPWNLLDESRAQSLPSSVSQPSVEANGYFWFDGKRPVTERHRGGCSWLCQGSQGRFHRGVTLSTFQGQIGVPPRTRGKGMCKAPRIQNRGVTLRPCKQFAAAGE